MIVEIDRLRLSIGSHATRWFVTTDAPVVELPIGLPAFPVDGRLVTPDGASLDRSDEPTVKHGIVMEHRFTTDVFLAPDGSRISPGVTFALVVRCARDSRVVRFRYELAPSGDRSPGATPRLTHRSQNGSTLRYLDLPMDRCHSFSEITLSEFDEHVHSYRPVERIVASAGIEHGEARMGPIVTAWVTDETGVRGTILVAYEHGSQTPDAFLHYRFEGDRCNLEPAKNNFPEGLELASDVVFESIWFDVAVTREDEGSADVASLFRGFVLRDLSANAESRKPYLFYNTWNYQERHQAWEKGRYLDTMRADRILAEIDAAHEMGIDVFVIDTGWYGRTGEWSVNRAFFPEGLRPIGEKLDGYGMKLGLWFSPRQAAVGSRIARDHLDCRSSRDGEAVPPVPVWETEESYSMCIVSRYWEAFADELIRCHGEYGVTYFKWDAVGQYGCDDPGHFHGDVRHSRQERADLQAFEQVRYMQKVIDKLCAAVPEAIVDFDITEAGRSVGLAFLASGKYFLVNNGPYYRSYDDPEYAPGGGMGSNVFAFPGPARARVCRSPLAYDRYVPSVLFLTHYLPDDPESSQIVNLASLMLGQNGIWGDLLGVSPRGRSLFGETLSRYRQVRDDITRASPTVSGTVGSSPEVHEKILASTGRGVVSLFAPARGTYRYITRMKVFGTQADAWHASPNASVEVLDDGRARITVEIDRDGAGFVLFGVR